MTVLTLQVKQVIIPVHCKSLGELTKLENEINLDKCQLIVSSTENAKIKLNDFTIANPKKEKILCIIFDDRLKCQY